eukprot:m.236698 g.236698  ORF g.236698 m.236698 type:complete len:58 (-) comp13013_c0_seq1:190-363(-)
MAPGWQIRPVKWLLHRIAEERSFGNGDVSHFPRRSVQSESVAGRAAATSARQRHPER